MCLFLKNWEITPFYTRIFPISGAIPSSLMLAALIPNCFFDIRKSMPPFLLPPFRCLRQCGIINTSIAQLLIWKYLKFYLNKISLFTANGSFAALDQPDIEFMLSHIYQFNQTGRRQLKGIFHEVYKNGQPSQVSYGPQESVLYGRALKFEYGKSIHLDVADESLSVGGWLFVEEFTIGTYIWVPDKEVQFDIWHLLLEHKAEIDNNHFDKYKFKMWAIREVEITKIGFTKYPFNDMGAVMTPILEKGWIHVAYTYDPNEKDGSLRAYLNGQPKGEFQISLSSNQIGSMYDIITIIAFIIVLIY